MALIVEDGSGVAGAESYPTIAWIEAYCAARPHRTEFVTWAAASTANKEGTAREGTQYLDATWGPYYRGTRRGHVQGLLWPRTGALDDAGYPLPDLPPQLLAAVAELAVRALSARLAPDAEHGGKIKRELKQVGDLKKEIEYAGVAVAEKKYGMLEGLLAPILNGSQPSAGGATWYWR